MAIFLRETRTRHSLLTRTKTFHNSKKDEAEHDDDPTALKTNSLETAHVIEESESDPEFDIHEIPHEDPDETPAQKNGRSKRRKEEPSGDAEGTDEKKLGFSTTYESFNIHGWVLCLLITRKDGRTSSSTTAEQKQPLMEEWISTQAQTTLEED